MNSATLFGMATPIPTIHPAGSDPQSLAQQAIANPALVAALIRGIEASPAKARFGCAKALHLLSEQQPELLYSHFDEFVSLLCHKNRVYQWEATFVLSQLAGIDAGDKFEAIFNKYFAPIKGREMITAANAIRGGARIARAKPALADRIAAEILKVERAHYATAECRNVAIGHAIVVLEGMCSLLRDPAPVTRFVRRQLKNRRPATRRKAEHFLVKAKGPGREATGTGPHRS